MRATELEPDADDLRLRAGLDQLVAAGVLARVSGDPRAIRLFMDCDLASLVENQRFETLDPRTLDARSRASFESRVSWEPSSPNTDEWFRSAFFILENGKVAGTIGLSNRFWGSSRVSVSSLYVLPEYR